MGFWLRILQLKKLGVKPSEFSGKIKRRTKPWSTPSQEQIARRRRRRRHGEDRRGQDATHRSRMMDLQNDYFDRDFLEMERLFTGGGVDGGLMRNDSSHARVIESDTDIQSSRPDPVGECSEVLSPVQALIPGLPDEIGIMCLARLPYKQRTAVKAVNSRWNEVLSGSVFYNMQQANDLLQDHLCICQLARPITSTRLSLVARLYSPVLGTWMTLPSMPLWDGPGILADFECVSLGPHLFVVGGSGHLGLAAEMSDDSEQFSAVSRFDVLKARWEVGPKLNSPRSEFVAGAIGSRLYVVDGIDEAPPEMLDVDAHPARWNVLEEYNDNMSIEVQGSFVRHKMFHIVRRGQSVDPITSGPSLVDVYDPDSNSWHTIQNFCSHDDHVFQSCGRSFAVVDDYVYGIFNEASFLDYPSELYIRCLDESCGRWETVACYMQAKQLESMEFLTSLQLVGVGKKHLFVIATGLGFDKAASSFMSILDVSGVKNGRMKAEWQAECVPIRDVIGEPSQVFGATSIAV